MTEGTNGTPENDASGETPDLRSVAMERMKRDSGTWDCTWEFLDEEGEIASSTTGLHKMELVFEGTIMLIHIEAPEMESYGVTTRYYDPHQEKIVWQSVDNNGDLWTFLEEVDGSSAYSLPHDNHDGTVSHLRFKPTRETETEVEVLMEMSEDKENWQPIFRMSRLRRTD